MTAVVVGSGVAGLFTAKRLTKEGYDVTIVTDKRSPFTTSDVAGALWFPADDLVGVSFDKFAYERMLGHCFNSLRVIDNLEHETSAAGIIRAHGKELYANIDLNPSPWWKPALPDLKLESKSDLEKSYLKLDPRYTCAYDFSAPCIDPSVCIPYLTKSILHTGRVEFVVDKLTNLEEASNLLVQKKFKNQIPDLIFNCSGLGARQLVNDPLVYPVRGQTTIVNNVKGLPQDDEPLPFLSDGHGPNGICYVIPRTDGKFVVGGTGQKNDWSTETCPLQHKAILQRAANMCGLFKDVKIVSIQAGLRPMREGGPRVEVVTSYKEKDPIISHCYGFGASGWTFGPGAADSVACDGLKAHQQRMRGGKL